MLKDIWLDAKQCINSVHKNAFMNTRNGNLTEKNEANENSRHVTNLCLILSPMNSN